MSMFGMGGGKGQTGGKSGNGWGMLQGGTQQASGGGGQNIPGGIQQMVGAPQASGGQSISTNMPIAQGMQIRSM